MGSFEKSSRDGLLYVVATPIGNLSDTTARARDVLSAVDVIAAEDTRHTRRLLQHYAINTPCVTLHEHNERKVCGRLVARMRAGERIALVSDAGTPLISDPGYHLVRQAQAAGLRVIPVPGPSALMAALSVCGLSTHRFAFEGFLPARAAERRAVLQSLVDEPRTLAFFEAPHRILGAIRDMCEVFGGERTAVLARELTKLHETIHRDLLCNAVNWLEADPNHRKGEFVVLVEGNPVAAKGTQISSRAALEALLEVLPPATAAAVAARLTGERRNTLYRLALQIQAGPGRGGKAPS